MVEFREGSSGEEVTRLIPGKVAFPSISLSRPIQRGLEMTAWHELVILGDIGAARKTCELVVYSYEGKPVARYHLENAWPSKVEIGALTAGGSEVLMETITLVCERMERVPA